MNPWKSISSDGQTITINKFNGLFNVAPHVTPNWIEANATEIVTAAVVDVETSGLDFRNDKIIEIAIRTLRFHKPTGHLISVDETYSALQEQNFPLTAEITRITGIIDQDLKGQNIEWAKVKSLINKSSLIIAHNAAFDRPFIERELGGSTDKVWACTWKQIDWEAKGFGIKQLALLCAYHGFFADAHRALSDVDALLHLLSFPDTETQKGYFSELHFNAHRSHIKLIASGAPFESKDKLRNQGYRWNTEIRSWSKMIYADAVPAEVEWLELEVYQGRFLGQLLEIPLMEQFRAVL